MESQRSRGIGRPGLTLTMCGPQVGAGRLSVNTLVEIVQQTQKILRQIGRVLSGCESGRRGRDFSSLEQGYELFLVGWHPGSAVAEFELPPPSVHQELSESDGAECVWAMVSGIAQNASRLECLPVFPRGFNLEVLQSCRKLTQVFDHGVERIELATEIGDEATACTIDGQFRQRLDEWQPEPDTSSDVVRTGRLEAINGHLGLRGTLWSAKGEKWICHFAAEHEPLLHELWMNTITVVGQEVSEPGRDPVIFVRTVGLAEQSTGLPFAAGSQSFWQSSSLDDLASRQGATVIGSMDELDSLWPVESFVEVGASDLLEHVLSERAMRRTFAVEEQES